ncbi:MAG: hypothetical protein ACLU9S_09255 [Oscillospiraceae bacterium]
MESAAVISTVLPNTTYTFSIQAADGTTVLNGVHTVTTPEAPAFSQYGLRRQPGVHGRLPPLRKTRTGPPRTWSRTNKPPSLPPAAPSPSSWKPPRA